jgi:hypothetical protein
MGITWWTPAAGARAHLDWAMYGLASPPRLAGTIILGRIRKFRPPSLLRWTADCLGTMLGWTDPSGHLRITINITKVEFIV